MKELTILRNTRKRLEARSVQAGDCIEFRGPVNNSGYAKFWYMGKTTYAHRVSFIVARGGIPEGKQIDHKCRNKICINPKHLGYVTPQENIARSMKHRTHLRAVQESALCPKGHTKAYNTTKTGHCKTCKNEYNKAYRERRNGENQ